MADTRYCDECGGKNREQAKFCGFCGKSLSADLSPTKPLRKKSRWKTFGLIVLGIILVRSMIDFAPYSDPGSELERRGVPFSKNQFLQEVKDGNTEVVELFLLAGIEDIELEWFEAEWFTRNILNRALDDAVKNGRGDTVKVLLAHGTNPTQQSPLCTLLLW